MLPLRSVGSGRRVASTNVPLVWDDQHQRHFGGWMTLAQWHLGVGRPTPTAHWRGRGGSRTFLREYGRVHVRVFAGSTRLAGSKVALAAVRLAEVLTSWLLTSETCQSGKYHRFTAGFHVTSARQAVSDSSLEPTADQATIRRPSLRSLVLDTLLFGERMRICCGREERSGVHHRSRPTRVVALAK